MCILCVVQKWSRRVATMLPWMLIPLSIVWALSQLLPPGLRFEIGSPQLACVLLLLVILFWYEVLGPKLSVWRVKRAARIRERRRVMAIELQKLRKSATRRCRNCRYPYRDQNPGGGGRFMCSNCGHVSKRPVLEFPKMGRDEGIGWDVLVGFDWKCVQDWAPESGGDWSCPAKFLGSGDEYERCSTVKSYSGVFVLARRLLSSIFFRMRWLWRKIFRVDTVGEDLDKRKKGLASRRGDGGDFQESRVEKARRKAEERRQARLEKEMLEDEERKQREEVAILVEERRRLRDEKLEAEKKDLKTQVPGQERNGGKETESRKQERRKEKDKGSSKSNSDGEDLDKNPGRGKSEYDKKPEHERYDSHKRMAVNHKSNASEVVHGSKIVTNKNRYFDRMKGTFLSSSSNFNSAPFFGKTIRNPVARASKPAIGFVDHRTGHGNVGDSHSTGLASARSTYQPVSPDRQIKNTGPKKSWHQLFTRSSAVSSSPGTNRNSSSIANSQAEVQSTASINLSTDNQINSGQTVPAVFYPSADDLSNSTSIANRADESMYPSLVKESGHGSIPEDVELFEDPCYVPEPISLFGPVTADDFPLNFGAGFVAEGQHVSKNIAASAEVSKPSPIKPPTSRVRGSENRCSESGQAICVPKSQNMHSLNLDDSSKGYDHGTWQMWGTPLAQDGLGVIGRPSGWSFPIGVKENAHHDVVSPPHNNMISKQAKENNDIPPFFSPENLHASKPQNGGLFSPLGHDRNDSDPCIRSSLPQFPVDEGSHFLPHDLMDNLAHNEVTYGIPDGPAAGHPVGLFPANHWSMEDWRMHGSEKVRGQFATTTDPGVQPMWSFN